MHLCPLCSVDDGRDDDDDDDTLLLEKSNYLHHSNSFCNINKDKTLRQEGYILYIKYNYITVQDMVGVRDNVVGQPQYVIMEG